MLAPRTPALLLGLALGLICVPAAGQYAAGDTIIADQTIMGTNWPLWGITPQGTLYTVTASLPLSAYSVAPAPDNRTLWVSGKGNAGYTLASVAPDGTITNINVDFQNLFTSIDVDGNGNAILCNLPKPEIKKIKYNTTTITTLHQAMALSNISGAGMDLQTGDLVMVDANGIFQANLFGNVTVSTVIPFVGTRSAPAGLHDDPETGTMVGSWGSDVYRLIPGTPGVLTTIWSGATLETLGSLDRNPFDGSYVIPAAATPISSRPSAVYRFDASTATITTMITYSGTHRASPVAATVAGSRHLCGGGGVEARPGQPFALMVSSPNEPGVAYVIACSLGFGPGIPLGNGRKVYLTPDALFFYSLLNTGIFWNFQGNLMATGEGIGVIQIPNIPQLSGLRFFAAAVTLNNNRISVISDTLGVTIQ